MNMENQAAGVQHFSCAVVSNPLLQDLAFVAVSGRQGQTCLSARHDGRIPFRQTRAGMCIEPSARLPGEPRFPGVRHHGRLQRQVVDGP